MPHIDVISPSGELGSVDSTEIRAAVNDEGYRLATPKDIAEFDKQAQYGEGLSNSVKAGLEGAARGVSFGASDYLLPKLPFGPTTEALSERKSRNPVASTVGEIGGVVGSSLLIPGGGLPGLVGKAARGAEGLVAARTAESILGSVGKKAIGSAIEGAFYGAGNVVSEAALGDPALTGEKALSQIGYSGLLAGALGGGLKLAGALAPKVGAIASEVGGKAFDKASSFVSGLPEAEVKKIRIERLNSLVSKATKEVEDSALNPDFQSRMARAKEQGFNTKKVWYHGTNADIKEFDPALLGSNTTGPSKKLGFHFASSPEVAADYAVGGDTPQVKAAISKADKAIEDAKNFFSELRKKGVDVATEKESTSELGKEIREKYINIFQSNEEIDRLSRAAQAIPEDQGANIIPSHIRMKNPLIIEPDEGQLGFETAEAIKQAKADGHDGVIIKNIWDSVDTAQKRKTDVAIVFDPKNIRSIHSVFDPAEAEGSNILGGDWESLVSKAKKPIADSIGAQAASMKEAVDAIKGQGELLKGGVLGTAAHALGVPHPLIGAGIAAYGALNNPELTMKALAHVESLVQRATKVLNANTNALFSATSKEAIGSLTPYLSAKANSGASSSESLGDEYSKAVAKINEVSTHPEAFMNVMDQATQALYPHAPNVVGQIQQSAGAAFGFLQGKLPKPLETSPLSSEFVPSQAEMSKFMHYYSVVNDPMLSLKELRMGTLTPDTIETMTQVSPKLYQEMKQGIMDKILEKGSQIPYQKRLMLSMFLQEPLDNTLKPSSLLSTQGIYAGHSKSNESTGAPNSKAGSASRVGKINVASRAKTPTQKVNLGDKL